MKKRKILWIIGISMLVMIIGALGITYYIKSCDTQSDVVAAELVCAIISRDVDGAYNMLHYDESREQFETEFIPLCNEWYNKGGVAEYKLKQKDWSMHSELVNGSRATSYECLYYIYSGNATFTLRFERIESEHGNGLEYFTLGVLTDKK